MGQKHFFFANFPKLFAGGIHILFMYKRSTVQMTNVQNQQSKFSNSRFILLDGKKSIGVAEGHGKLHHNFSPHLAPQHSEAKRAFLFRIQTSPESEAEGFV